MAHGDLICANGHRATHGTKAWYLELNRRLQEYAKNGTQECFTPSYIVFPLSNRDHALLQNEAQIYRRDNRKKIVTPVVKPNPRFLGIDE